MKYKPDKLHYPVQEKTASRPLERFRFQKGRMRKRNRRGGRGRERRGRRKKKKNFSKTRIVVAT